MEFVVITFSIVVGFNLWASFKTMDQCNNEIVDIYYPKDKEEFAYDNNCYYTKTLVDCQECNIVWVNRKYYHQFAKSYTDYGLSVPYPPRTDTDRVFKPITRF